ncbi:MAG: phenylacetate-CoA oxygenase subunit PaaC [Burkholderiaceae bacterium]|jgi:ring-1,2-phenylacetyl-CoA epoxidase subunit PaaC|nr:phenylacetate-CoA oxygenase subunit PaaC [Burkholderiaceae bacterium]
MTTTIDLTRAQYVESVLRIADTSLMLGQRLSEWCGHGPVIEEDIALTNIALDLIGQARLLLTHAGKIEGNGRDEDRLAFLRAESDFRNLSMVELPNQDFARTILRNFLVAAWQAPLWSELRSSSDAELAAIAEKSAKETRYHLQHAAEWTVRLGDGTDESRRRMQRALDTLWPYTAEFFADDELDRAANAAGLTPLPSALLAAWESTVLPVLAEATLTVPARTPFLSTGRQGRHTEHMGHLLAPMQAMQRTYPGCTW